LAKQPRRDGAGLPDSCNRSFIEMINEREEYNKYRGWGGARETKRKHQDFLPAVRQVSPRTPQPQPVPEVERVDVVTYTARVYTRWCALVWRLSCTARARALQFNSQPAECRVPHTLGRRQTPPTDADSGIYCRQTPPIR